MQQFIERVKLAWAILRGRDGGFVTHAKRELEFAGYYDGDEMNEAMAQSLIDLLRVMGAQGHSGFSASHLRSLFGKAAAYEPFGPLTGEDDEWDEVDTNMYQNKRCGRVFLDTSEPVPYAYDIDAVVFEEPDGSRFTSRASRQRIAFPYVPRTLIARVKADATEEDKKNAAARAQLDAIPVS